MEKDKETEVSLNAAQIQRTSQNQSMKTSEQLRDSISTVQRLVCLVLVHLKGRRASGWSCTAGFSASGQT